MNIEKMKTEFFEERLMEVSGDGIKWYPRVVFGKKNGKYIAWSGAETVEEAEKKTVTAAWDYAREIDPFRELKKAWARGEDIQYRYKSDDWIDTPDPAWHPFYEYRIKPESESKYVPFTFEDAELFMSRTVIAKDKSCKVVITYSDNEDVLLGTVGRNYKHLLENYTFLDGSPCGKEVEE